MKRLVVILFILFAGNISAQQRSVSDIDADIKHQQAKINNSTQLLNSYNNESAASQRQLELLQARIAEREQMTALFDEQIMALELQIKANNDSLKLLSQKLERVSKQYAMMIRRAYANYLINSDLTLIFAADDFNGAVQRSKLLERYNRARLQKAESIVRMRKEIEQSNERLTAQREELAEKREEKECEYTKMRADETEMKRVLEKLNRQIASARSSVAAQHKQLRDLQTERDNAAQRSARASAQTTTTSSRGTTTAQRQETSDLTKRFEQNRGKLPYPVAGTKIRGFGETFRSNGTQKNQGFTFACVRGAAVMAVFDGIIGNIMPLSDGLSCITIRHGNYYTSYTGLSSVSVKINDQIKARQIIGNVSNGDNRNNWQIDFYMFDSTFRAIDPTPWLVR